MKSADLPLIEKDNLADSRMVLIQCLNLSQNPKVRKTSNKKLQSRVSKAFRTCLFIKEVNTFKSDTYAIHYASAFHKTTLLRRNEFRSYATKMICKNLCDNFESKVSHDNWVEVFNINSLRGLRNQSNNRRIHVGKNPASIKKFSNRICNIRVDDIPKCSLEKATKSIKPRNRIRIARKDSSFDLRIGRSSYEHIVILPADQVRNGCCNETI